MQVYDESMYFIFSTVRTLSSMFVATSIESAQGDTLDHLPDTPLRKNVSKQKTFRE
jgi:hypothetical protein